MAEIVGSLFGLSPDMYRRASQERDFAQAQAIGARASAPGTMMSPSLGPIYAEAAQQGQMIGRGVGALLGAQDPELQRITQIQQLSSQFDLSSADGMRDFARALQPIAPNESMMAAKRADEMTTSGLTRKKTQADITRTEGLISKEDAAAAQNEQLRAELAALPPTATNADRIAVVSRYGNPDVILRTLQASDDRQAALEQRRETADANRAQRQETAALTAATREETRSAKQLREDEKRQDRLDKQSQSANAAIAGADRIINEVGEAKAKVSGFTAGLGSYLSVLPLTEAKDLSKRLTTIKANLGFDRLQQMRDASPTGGALGQVAVQELIALQSTIASLDQDQSPAQLKQALDKIETSYAKWRETVMQAGKSTTGNQAAGAREIDFNSLPKRK